MLKADTPTPKEPEKVTTPGGTDTPADERKGDPTPPASSEETNKKVTELEGKVEALTNELEKQSTITKTAQRKERIEAIERKKVEEILKKIRSGEISADEEIPLDETSTEKETRQTARIKIQNLIIENPDYQELIKDNLTLKEVIKNNPLALIGDYLDSDDAVEQIKEKLDKLVSSKSVKTQPEGETGEEKGKEFEAGPAQPGESGTPAKEENKPEAGSDAAIEQSIQNRMRVV